MNMADMIEDMFAVGTGVVALLQKTLASIAEFDDNFVVPVIAGMVSFQFEKRSPAAAAEMLAQQLKEHYCESCDNYLAQDIVLAKASTHTK